MSFQLLSEEFDKIRSGYDDNPAKSYSLNSRAYTEQSWYDVDREAIIQRSWQWVCHSEKLREFGAYVTASIDNQPVLIVRDKEGELRAFYNVCQHRAMQLLEGEGKSS